MRFAFDLTWPPSVNHYYMQTGRGVVIGPAGRAYRQRVAATLRVIGIRNPLLGLPLQTFTGVDILTHPGTRRRYDLDNILKCLLDSLTIGRLWSDDSLVADLRVRRGLVTPGCPSVAITITTAIPETP